jgi:diguanylate cyclase (GGDEF)-like protein
MSDDKTQIQVSPFVDPDGAGEGGASEVNAYVIVLSGTSTGKMYKLEEGEYLLGRGKDADIRLVDDGISRSHAKIRRKPDGTMEVIDLDSTNGTYINNDRVADGVLKDGDRILIGPVTILKFSYQDGLEEQFQQQLYESATRDALTGAYNRRFFIDALDKDFSHAIRHETPLSIVMLDLDHFKRVNDTWGHPAGDHVLQHLSATIERAIRNDDLFCRIGGEEFAILMRDTAERNACLFAERIRALIEQTKFTVDDTDIPVTISIGVSTLKSVIHKDPQALLADADRYLYQAKGRGRNRVEASILSG